MDVFFFNPILTHIHFLSFSTAKKALFIIILFAKIRKDDILLIMIVMWIEY